MSGITELQEVILAVLISAGPATDEELLPRVRRVWPGATPSGVRTRRAELVDAGKVGDSGQRRRTSTGRRSIVWVAR